MGSTSRAARIAWCKFFDVAEGFQHQQIDAAFDQGCDLLAKGGAGFLERGFAQRFNADPKRADRASNPDVEALGGFPGQPNPGQVDFAHLVFHAVAGQAKRISAESIGFNDLRTRLHVLMMQVADEVGLRDVQLVIAAIDEDALGVKQGPGGAVAQDRGLLQAG